VAAKKPKVPPPNMLTTGDMPAQPPYPKPKPKRKPKKK
jgi:hypothetical protein